VIIIAREEWNEAMAGLSRSRQESLSFDKWMPAASGKPSILATEPSPLVEQADVQLYRNRLWRCE